MRLLVTTLLIGLVGLLTSCGGPSEQGGTLRADFNPALLGFEVDDDGTIIIFANTVVFRNQAGAPPATITGYEVWVYDDEGEEALGSGSDLFGGHLGISVPAGYSCADPDVTTCDLFDRVNTDTSSEPRSFHMVAGPIARHLIMNDLVRLTAEVTFHAQQRNQPVEFTEVVSIAYPVGGGD